MSSAACEATLAAPLLEFHRKLLAALDGRRPPLSKVERMWMLVFGRVAARFDGLTKDESFALSFDALCRCHAKGAAGYYRYLRQACLNAHRDFLPDGPTFLPLPADAACVGPWGGIDARLDLADAVARLDEPHARVIRMHLAGYRHSEMADALGVGDEQVRRLLRQAEARLRELLGVDYGQA
jgi:hypothetical protein